MIAWIQARAASIVTVLLFAAPLLAFLLTIALVKGHASTSYYEAVAQIIPVVILALAIELRYFSPNRQLPEPLKARFRHPERAHARHRLRSRHPACPDRQRGVALAVVASESSRPPRAQHHGRRPGRGSLRPGRGDPAAERRRWRAAAQLRPTSNRGARI